MQTLLDILLAAGTLASLVLHYFGRKNPTAEKIADEIDSVEGKAKAL